MTSVRVLVVGAGGLGCSVLDVFARSGVEAITLVDDDRVDATNIHRQILFDEADVGRAKVEVARERLATLAPQMRVTTREDRFVPENADELIDGHAMVVEGADNYATKFLVADTARAHGIAAVHAGAVRLNGWVLGARFGVDACLRCVFERAPDGRADTCSEAGVLGPVVGVVGSIEGAMALAVLRGEATGLVHYDARRRLLRYTEPRRREGCECASTPGSV